MFAVPLTNKYLLWTESEEIQGFTKMARRRQDSGHDLKCFFWNVLNQGHQWNYLVITVEAKGFDMAHERLVRELGAHMHNFLLFINGVLRILSVLSRNDSTSRLEFIMEAMCACWKACEGARVVEDCAENVVARVIGGTTPEPIAFGTMHPVKYPVVRFV